MDNDGRIDSSPVLTFAPNLWLSGGLCLVFLVLAGLFAGTLVGADGDRAGRVLYGVAALVLAAVCATDLLWRPRLRVDRVGIAVRSPSLTTRIGWADVERIGLEERRRLGITVRALEIDAGERLVLLGARSLGQDPRAVVGLVQAFRPPG